MLQVELAEEGALREAVHHGNLVVVQVDLHQIWQASESASHICQKVVLQVDVEQGGALAGQDVLFGILRVGHTDRRQVLVRHLQVGLFAKVRRMMYHWLEGDFAKHQLHSDWLGVLRYIRRRNLDSFLKLLLAHLILHGGGRSFVILTRLFLIQSGLLGGVGSILAHIVSVDLDRGHDLVIQTGRLFLYSQLTQSVDVEHSEGVYVVEAIVE